mmetsp:Transcript_45721/g.151583  ORF Transcript_45721/g.151583 Transcript_45721/m.151583 type:complete len:213 (+) Transcript_45721:543-1181(+)
MLQVKRVRDHLPRLEPHGKPRGDVSPRLDVEAALEAVGRRDLKHGSHERVGVKVRRVDSPAPVLVIPHECLAQHQLGALVAERRTAQQRQQPLLDRLGKERREAVMGEATFPRPAQLKGGRAVDAVRVAVKAQPRDERPHRLANLWRHDPVRPEQHRALAHLLPQLWHARPRGATRVERLPVERVQSRAAVRAAAAEAVGRHELEPDRGEAG